MRQGYVKTYRKLFDSELWLKEPFTRGQAWVDLIGLANHKDGYIRKRGIRVNLHRGEVGWSERELASRWQWSRGKVQRFLFELCSENESKLIPQTDPQNKNVVSCYLITNYDLYQGDGTTDETTNGPQTGHKRVQNKNDKNGKNERIKKNIGVFVLPEWFPLEAWEMFVAHRKAVRAPVAKGTEEALFKNFQTWKEQGYEPQYVVATMIERGWRSFKREWIEKDGGVNGNPGNRKGSDNAFLRALREEDERRDARRMGKGAERISGSPSDVGRGKGDGRIPPDADPSGSDRTH